MHRQKQRSEKAKGITQAVEGKDPGFRHMPFGDRLPKPGTGLLYKFTLRVILQDRQRLC